jgi:hypothetical protein
VKIIQISKNRIREYLAERLANRLLQSEVSDLVLVFRYNALGGFEFLSDSDLFEYLVSIHPELDLLMLTKSDELYLYLGVKSQNIQDEEFILNDLRKVIHLIG